MNQSKRKTLADKANQLNLLSIVVEAETKIKYQTCSLANYVMDSLAMNMIPQNSLEIDSFIWENCKCCDNLSPSLIIWLTLTTEKFCSDMLAQC